MNRFLGFSFCAAFSFLMKGCGVERCLWQMQRDEARAKQGESKRQRSFDYALALVKSGKRKKKQLAQFPMAVLNSSQALLYSSMASPRSWYTPQRANVSSEGLKVSFSVKYSSSRSMAPWLGVE